MKTKVIVKADDNQHKDFKKGEVGYIDGYASLLSAEEIEATLAGFRESPETDTLVPGFLELVFS